LNVNLFIATFRSAPAYRSPRKGYPGTSQFPLEPLSP